LKLIEYYIVTSAFYLARFDHLSRKKADFIFEKQPCIVYIERYSKLRYWKYPS